jgi:hypothetical protein
VESTPRAYKLKAGNAASPISTFAGTSSTLLPPCFASPTKLQDCAVDDPAHVEAFDVDIAAFCNSAFSKYRAFELVMIIGENLAVRP